MSRHEKWVGPSPFLPPRSDTPLTSSVDSYLAALPPRARELLDELRAIVRSAVPDAGERLSYRIPTLFHHGALVAVPASRDHAGLHLMSPALVDAFRGEPGDLGATRATLRIPHGRPVPRGLIKGTVRARVEERGAKRKV